MMAGGSSGKKRGMIYGEEEGEQAVVGFLF
jgi:hypothetical protein